MGAPRLGLPMDVAYVIPGPPQAIPDWMDPWVVGASVLFFAIVVAWAIRQRTR